MYSDDACPSHLQSQSVSLELMGRRSGKLDERGKSDDVNSIHFGADSCVCTCVCSCVCGSAHGSGCVVDGRSAI